MRNNKEIRADLEKLPLWKLTIFSANVEYKIMEKKKQGMKNVSSLKHTKNKRSLYREVLLKKLKEWKKAKKKDGKIEEGIGFADLQELDLENEFLELS